MLASAYAESGRLDESLTEYQKALAAEPSDSATHQAIGIVYLRKNDFHRAIEHLKTAVELNPDDLDAHLALGKALFLANPASVGRAEFDKVLEKAPNNAEAHVGVGACLHANGELEPAIREYLRALELGYEPTSLYGALFSALQSYATLGNVVPYVKKALIYYPGNESLQSLARGAAK